MTDNASFLSIELRPRRHKNSFGFNQPTHDLAVHIDTQIKNQEGETTFAQVEMERLISRKPINHFSQERALLTVQHMDADGNPSQQYPAEQEVVPVSDLDRAFETHLGDSKGVADVVSILEQMNDYLTQVSPAVMRSVEQIDLNHFVQETLETPKSKRLPIKQALREHIRGESDQIARSLRESKQRYDQLYQRYLDVRTNQPELAQHFIALDKEKRRDDRGKTSWEKEVKQMGWDGYHPDTKAGFDAKFNKRLTKQVKRQQTDSLLREGFALEALNEHITTAMQRAGIDIPPIPGREQPKPQVERAQNIIPFQPEKTRAGLER